MTCEQPHTLRIGMGQEESQRHTFDCRHCGEPITIRMDVDYEKLATPITAEKNAILVDEVPGAPIVNLDANCLIPEDAVGVDMSFFRIEEFHKRVQKALEARELGDLPKDLLAWQKRPFRRPDHMAEWTHIQRVWSLLSRGKDELAGKQLKRQVTALYGDDSEIDTLTAWLWRFLQVVIGRKFQKDVNAALNSLRAVSPEPLGTEVSTWFLSPSAQERSALYLSIISEFFELYEEWSQIIFYVQADIHVEEKLKATSVSFDKTKMFYGNAFEALGTLSELLAALNNVQQGRSYDKFELLTWDAYKQLDKASVFGPFSGNVPLSALCQEADNTLRNASHHRRLHYDNKAQIVSYGLGKGGAGKQVQLGYVQYLERCVRIAFQIFALLLIEIALSYPLGRKFPA